jgi:uncharacterized Zn finger protein
MATKKVSIKKVSKKAGSPFAKLTWDDLNSWAGSKIVDRGRGYKQSGCVKDLAITPNGSLIAWVRGSELYATTVEMHGKKLASSCSCPYGATCKHAVAVVLECLDRLKNNQPLPQTGQDDKRLRILMEQDEDDEDYDEDYDDEDEWDED